MRALSVKPMKRLLLAGVVALISSQALAQTADAGLATPTGHELSLDVASYTYIEPGTLRISIHAPKIGGEYTGTLSLTHSRHWFAQANIRGIFGNATYDGYCSPWLIRPNNTSPNGYELDIGSASPCSETGDEDWYFDTRALVGKDFIGQKWG